MLTQYVAHFVHMEDCIEQVQKIFCIKKTHFFPPHKGYRVILTDNVSVYSNHIHQYSELLLQMLIHWHVCSLAVFS